MRKDRENAFFFGDLTLNFKYLNYENFSTV